MDPAIFSIMDTRLRARGTFNREAIEEALREIYAVGGDPPTVDDDEFHCMISEAAAHYARLGLSVEKG